MPNLSQALAGFTLLALLAKVFGVTTTPRYIVDVMRQREDAAAVAAWENEGGSYV